MTAIRTITRLQDADDANVTPAVGEDGKALVYDHGTGKFVLADRGGGSGLPLTAGSGEALTGTLYLDPGSDDSALLWRVPITTADVPDIIFRVGKATFSGVDDIVWNLGWNQGGEVATKHTWYLQMEYDYVTGGKRYVEAHFNLFGPGQTPQMRPLTLSYTTDATTGTVLWRTSTFYVSNMANVQKFSLTGLDSSPVMRADASVQFYTPAVTNAFNVVSATNTITVFQIDGTANDVTIRPRLLVVKNITSGTNWITANSFSNQLHIGTGAALARLSLTVENDTYKGFVVQAASGQTKTVIETQDSAAAVQFAIGPAGQLRTNQTAANTAAPSGVTARQLPIYDTAGTLLGYIPIYASAWT
jgi:hypothetical protein